jgi:hypothetical protein
VERRDCATCRRRGLEGQPADKTARRLLGSSAKNSYAQRSTSTGIYRRAHLVP